MTDKRLARQKKVSAGTSIVGGTLGLGGLAAMALKKQNLANKLSVTAGGLGGVGAYNYASIQNQESKKKGPRQTVYVVRNKKQIKNIKSGLQPVTKGLEVMDYGLSDVRQGENVISKAMPQKQRKAGENGAAVGQVATPVAGYLGAQAFKGGKMGFGLARSTNSGMPSSLATAGRVGATAAKAGAKPGQMFGAAMKHPFATAGMVVGGGLAGQKAGHKLGAPKPAVGPKKPKQTMSKAWVPKLSVGSTKTPAGRVTSWANSGVENPLYKIKASSGVNIRNSKGSITNAKGGGGSLTPLGREVRNAAAVGTGAGLVYSGGKKALGKKKPEVHKAFKPKNPFSLKPMHTNFKHANTLRHNATRQSLRADDLQSRATAAYRNGDEAGANRLASKGNKVFMNSIRSSSGEGQHLYAAKQNAARARRNTAIAGGVGTAAAGGGGYAFGRKKKNVKKAYNPEAKRQRRLENGATALSVGSGATAAGAFHYGRKAAGAKGTGVKGLRAKSLTAYKGGLKSTAKAGGLGLTAVGLAVSSDRVRSYRSGRGGSYRQLHRGS